MHSNWRKSKGKYKIKKYAIQICGISSRSFEVLHSFAFSSSLCTCSHMHYCDGQISKLKLDSTRILFAQFNFPVSVVSMFDKMVLDPRLIYFGIFRHSIEKSSWPCFYSSVSKHYISFEHNLSS